MENNNRDNCIFCKIVDGKSPKTVIEFENNNVIIFKDIRPASDYHFLAIPKDHVKHCKELKLDHIPLLDEMQTTLDELLKKNGLNNEEISFGFHWPPFNSVSHLHMHGIGPISKMRFLSRWIFKPNNIWYCTPQYVKDKIRKENEIALNTN